MISSTYKRGVGTSVVVGALVLGVAPGAVRLLQTRPRGTVGGADATAPAAFASRLFEALRQPPR
jgi:hypothetical protein